MGHMVRDGADAPPRHEDYVTQQDYLATSSAGGDVGGIVDFAARQLTVADIALYGYTHLAERCDFDLSTFPAIRDWLKRVEAAPGFVAMDGRPADVDDPASIAAGV